MAKVAKNKNEIRVFCYIGPIMEIKFFITGFKLKGDKKSDYEESIHTMFSIAAADIGLSPDFVQDILVSDDINFKKALHVHDKRKQLPQGVFAEPARTIPHKDEEGTPRCSIIIRNEIAEALSHTLTQPPENWNLQEKSFRYIIYKEMGRCLDYRNRKSKLTPPKAQIKTFSIQKLWNYYSNTIASEFAAGFFSARGVSPDLYQDRLQKITSSTKKHLEELEKAKATFDKSQESLIKIAHQAASLFWVTLVHYSELMGNRLNNEQISKEPLTVWEGAGPLSASILSEMEKHLCGIWDSYPDWPKKHFNFLLNIWKFLAMENGVKFLESAQGDGIFW